MDNNSQNKEDYQDAAAFSSFVNFDELEICPNLLRGIFGYGFEKPSPIQSTAIIPMIEKRNLIAQAQSGTGKTGAFTIGSLSRVNTDSNETQVLILSPTRELSVQIAEIITQIGARMSGLHVKIMVGGTAIREDVRDIQNHIPHVIVGCPGRVFDMIRRNHIDLIRLRVIVLDEADEMLSVGFEEQIYNIFQAIPESTSVALFSATLPGNIMRLSEKFMKNPVNISVSPEKLSLDGISQYYVEISNDQQKYETLKDLYQNISMGQCIIYCNSVQRVCQLHETMSNDDFPVCCIHGKMDKDERNQAFQDFKNGGKRVLISSDITARGIDVQQVNMVINFDLPSNMHNYLHRIGRGGRYGRKSISINLILKRDKTLMEDIQSYYHCQINALTDEAIGR